jgi:hypothetical protein
MRCGEACSCGLALRHRQQEQWALQHGEQVALAPTTSAAPQSDPYGSPIPQSSPLRKHTPFTATAWSASTGQKLAATTHSNATAHKVLGTQAMVPEGGPPCWSTAEPNMEV